MEEGKRLMGLDRVSFLGIALMGKKLCVITGALVPRRKRIRAGLSDVLRGCGGATGGRGLLPRPSLAGRAGLALVGEVGLAATAGSPFNRRLRGRGEPDLADSRRFDLPMSARPASPILSRPGRPWLVEPRPVRGAGSPGQVAPAQRRPRLEAGTFTAPARRWKEKKN
ncbi:hypothetical protein NL676_018551 [Syzygium grande]|nr:hypothetical protein NL676_018551 [Syzygium grande]